MRFIDLVRGQAGQRAASPVQTASKPEAARVSDAVQKSSPRTAVAKTIAAVRQAPVPVAKPKAATPRVFQSFSHLIPTKMEPSTLPQNNHQSSADVEADRLATKMRLVHSRATGRAAAKPVTASVHPVAAKMMAAYNRLVGRA